MVSMAYDAGAAFCRLSVRGDEVHGDLQLLRRDFHTGRGPAPVRGHPEAHGGLLQQRVGRRAEAHHPVADGQRHCRCTVDRRGPARHGTLRRGLAAAILARPRRRRKGALRHPPPEARAEQDLHWEALADQLETEDLRALARVGEHAERVLEGRDHLRRRLPVRQHELPLGEDARAQPVRIRARQLRLVGRPALRGRRRTRAAPALPPGRRGRRGRLGAADPQR
mmetsp:Transcript_108949/g.295368  ORF Transcript_108949/g.295368 Transcript_108949/m.295368 type:complete len:224 (+) Transcript_108949:760-1431(+)